MIAGAQLHTVLAFCAVVGAACSTGKGSEISRCHHLILQEVKGSEVEGVIRAYDGDIAVMEQLSGRKAGIPFAEVDLDGDGRGEIVTGIFHTGFCGSGGCFFLVLKEERSGEWKNVLEGVLATEIDVVGTETGGACDLILDRSRVYRWNGSQYVQEDVPASNGHD